MEILNYMAFILKDMGEQLLNKNDFINEVAKRCMVTPYVVDEIFNVSSGVIIENLLKGNQVEIPKLGKFILREKKETTYKNLYGNSEKTIGKMTYPLFQVTNTIKNRVKNGYQHKKITSKVTFSKK